MSDDISRTIIDDNGETHDLRELEDQEKDGFTSVSEIENSTENLLDSPDDEIEDAEIEDDGFEEEKDLDELDPEFEEVEMEGDDIE